MNTNSSIWHSATVSPKTWLPITFNKNNCRDSLHSYGAYNMPGAILSALHILTHLLLLQPWEGHTIYHSYVPDEETGALISSDLPQVTQL